MEYEKGQIVRYETDVGKTTGKVVKTPPYTESVAGDILERTDRVKVDTNYKGSMGMYEEPKVEKIEEVVL